MRRIWGLLALAAAFLALTPAVPAMAQSSNIYVLQLQQQLISERRLADDREAKLLRDADSNRRALQAKLTAAERRGSGAKAEADRLRSELDGANLREQQLLSDILKRNGDLISELRFATLATELEQLGAGATAELRTALDDFAGPDRAGAWTRIAAIAAAGSARDKRVAARIRTIMRMFNPESVTAEDVATRWRDAVAAEPDNVLGLTALASAEYEARHSDAALAALDRAQALATRPLERQGLAIQRLTAAAPTSTPDQLIALNRDALTATRALGPDDLPGGFRRGIELNLLYNLVSLSHLAGRFEDERALLLEVLASLKIMREADPDAIYPVAQIAQSLGQIAFLDRQYYRFDDMLAALTESTALLEKTVATQPIEAAYLNAPLHDQYVQICQIRLQQNRPDDMLAACRSAFAAQRKVPQSGQRDNFLVQTGVFLATLETQAGNRDRAAAILRIALDALDRLLAQAPGLPSYLRLNQQMLTGVALADDKACWSDVVTAWERLAAVEPLGPVDQQMFDGARSLAEMQPACTPIRTPAPVAADAATAP
ncbi:hypothetical protein [Sphingopyxis sp. KK2]|uniref:hypothetical protein n=1 Tax=Sphingopyxis sp. KK2 TaxID=1855727 RepID=UPI00097E5CB8|nr:hypothetical protein [Sphingopyxis sp. KK2]